MKTYALKQNLKQNHSNYSSEDFEVWKTLFIRQMNLLEPIAASEYLQGIKDIQFSANSIPNFEETNKLLLSKTGWSLEIVEGIISEPDFFNLLANKKFPATTWLRKLNELDYLPEPDMFHDVFGHVPLLTNQHFCDFYESMGKIGVEYIEQPEIIEMLGRLYWFTVEFGLIKSDNQLKIYGAGILSSYGESKYSISSEPKHLNFDAEQVMMTAFENDKIQTTYFVLDSFEDLYKSINTIKQIVKEKAQQAVKC